MNKRKNVVTTLITTASATTLSIATSSTTTTTTTSAFNIIIMTTTKAKAKGMNVKISGTMKREVEKNLNMLCKHRLSKVANKHYVRNGFKHEL